jgi:hypothetical protein
MRRTVAAIVLTLLARIVEASPDPCSLLKAPDLQAIAPGVSVGPGTVTRQPELGSATCSYHWGPGSNAASGRFNLHVTVSDASKAFPGTSGATIIQGLLAETKKRHSTAVVVPGVGQAAIFKSEAPIRANTTAYIKGLILQVDLDGLDGRTKKDQVIALLKAAAARL